MGCEAFVRPEVLVLLAFVPLLIARRVRRVKAAIPVSGSHLHGRLPGTIRVRWRWLPGFIRLVALAIAVGALAGPLVTEQVHNQQRGADVMLLIDVSDSMQALDFTPDRLGAARSFAERLIMQRPDDRVGVISFAGRTAMRIPLTLDRDALVGVVRGLAPDAEVLGDGTALGAAIVNAVERLSVGRAADRMLVVLSDGHGVREVISPKEAASLAAARHVRVFTVGIGSGGIVPYPTEFGTLDVTLPLDAGVLTDIAERTGGRYFAAPDTAALAAVIEALRQLEAAAPLDIVRNVRRRVDPLWALAALVALVIEWWLTATVLRQHPA